MFVRENAKKTGAGQTAGRVTPCGVAEALWDPARAFGQLVRMYELPPLATQKTRHLSTNGLGDIGAKSLMMVAVYSVQSTVVLVCRSSLKPVNGIHIILRVRAEAPIRLDLLINYGA